MKDVINFMKMNKKKIVALTFFSMLIFAVVLIGGCVERPDEPPMNRTPTSSPTETLAVLKPHDSDYSEGDIEIYVNPTKSLHGQTKNSILSQRKLKVEEYRNLGIFPENYEPKDSIFGQITDGADWVEDTQFFIHNPYLLVMTSAPNVVNVLLPFCSVNSVYYSNNRIDVKYKDQSAMKWFYYIYEHYGDPGGIVRLWFVNAYDAGFNYAHVDMDQSINIDPEWYASGNSVTKSVYSGHEFFHVGRKRKNNISPASPDARLKLINQNEKTIIYIKLWRERPDSVNTEEDFAYVINIEP
ncbi:MAG: hypothetical protein SVM80_04045 [Halobacteriota archaeon]|nr:hypothetical protein [Halobacteriota archaeon]